MRLLFVTQDPGGCNALLPVIKHLLNTKKDSLKILGAKSSVIKYQTEGIDFVDCTNFNDKQIENIVKDFNPDKIIFGTSGGFSLEDKVFAVARACGYKTISIIDSWMHYADRYRGADKISDLVLLVTDKVLVNDVYMKGQAISEGIPEDVIEITGNPYLLECVKKIKKDDYGKKISKILFISQPFSELPDLENKYNEMQVLDDLLYCLKQIELNNDLEIILRPHPRESVSKLESFIELHNDFNIKIDKKVELYDSINDSDLIFGMNSIVLVECVLAGKQVISYQPNISIQEDVLITNRLGISNFINNKDALLSMLKVIFSGVSLGNSVKKEKVEFFTDELVKKNAVENIVSLIYSY